MRFLIVDEEAAWCAGAWRLQEYEGHDVRIFCQKPEGKEHLKGMVEHVQTLEQGLTWVGRSGYIICADEMDASPIRRRGFKVYGGNAWTKKVENDRAFEMEVAKKAGIKIPNFHQIKSVDEGIRFIQENPDQYALKQTGHAPKEWNYIGKDEDGKDIILQLEWIKGQPEFKKMSSVPFILQEFVEGIEFACGAWWMGEDWKRDDDGKVLIELNREHKKELDGDIGSTTGEMGTVAMLTAEHTKLFEATLEKLTDQLKENASDVILDIDANCGITEEGEVYLYETTPREGYPIYALQHHLLEIETGQFFADLIDKIQGNVEVKKTWGVITVVGAGSFPHEGSNHEGSFKDQPVKVELDEHIWPFYLKKEKSEDFYRIADYYEYVAGVVYDDKDISKANDLCVEAMKKIDVRSPRYRHDIGKKFQEKELPKLQKMGFL